MTIADLMAAGDQSGCTALRRAAMPETWGVAIDAPECMAYPPSWNRSSGEVAAKMFTPGAAISGLPHRNYQIMQHNAFELCSNILNMVNLTYLTWIEGQIRQAAFILSFLGYWLSLIWRKRLRIILTITSVTLESKWVFIKLLPKWLVITIKLS